ncbi:MAG: protein kinase [Polyangiales bacterium]
MGAEPGSQERQGAPREVVAGRYELTRRLGRGGMGEVFSARDRSTGKVVALKRLLESAVSQRAPVAHFMREFHALSELRHPRIIEVYEYGVDRNVPYYTMELLDGQDLRDLSPLPYRDACLYLRDVASSLALLHARRLLHRDVSPRNVRRTSEGHCKLLDFGAMIPFGVPPNVTGTAPCIAPEALQGALLDQRSDLYSLGALAYCVLTGRHGHAVSQLAELPSAWARPLKRPKRIAEIPDELDELIMSLMSLDPMKRPRSAAEVIDWLSAIGQLPPDDAPDVARSFFTSTQLCGRTRETEELTRHVKRAAEGQGGAVMLEGSVGTGKSRMLSECVLLAQTCGLSVAHAVARSQRGTNYALARELMASLLQVAPLEAEVAGVRSIAWPRVAGNAALELAGQAGPDPGEQRARLQQSLLDVIGQVAESRPLLLAIDDVDRADEFSSALIAGLAHQAAKLPLLIVCTRTSGRGLRADALRGLATRIRLSELMRGQSAELAHSMFGNVPNIDLLNDWLYRVARGNPKHTLELAGFLFERGLVRYVEGDWVLPPDPIALEMPTDLTAGWALRLDSLSASALALAELLTLRRGGLSVELCLAVAEGPPESVFAGLDELVRAGVLESAGSDYVFAQDTSRQLLERRLSPERLRVLHRRWASVLAQDPSQDLEARLEAGWHMIHTEDELRGADMLAEVAPLFVDHGHELVTAIPALERALAVYERLGGPLAVRLRLRSSLVLAGYLFDYRLAFRYGEETIALLHEVSGLRLATQLSRYVGRHLGFILGTAFASVRRLWTPVERRGPPFYTALRYFVRSVMGLMGVRAISLDGPGTWSLFEKVQPLGAVPPFGSSGPTIYLTCRALALQMLGRESDVRQAIGEALREIRRGRRRDMLEVEYRRLLVGLLMADGVNESYHEASSSLERADMLDGLGTRLAHAGALRIRMNYYARRGDSDRAEECRHQIELQAIQGGVLWQGEWFSVPLEGMSGAAWTDLVSLRRALDRMERLAQDVPALAAMRDGVRISYHYRRGEYALAAELGDHYIAAHPPRTLVGWSATYGVIAQALVEHGQPERALRLCEDALKHASQEDLRYYVMYAPLETGYAMALAVLGQREQAEAIMRKRINSLRAHGEHASLVILYQFQARIASLVGDHRGLADALLAMREAALTSGLPAVILLADRVAELRAKRRSSPLPPAATVANDRVPEPEMEETAMTAFLQRRESGQKRSQSALWFLARYVCSEEAFLYRVKPGELQLMAAIPEGKEVPELTEALLAKVGDPSDASVLRLQSVDFMPSNDTEERSYRVTLLAEARRPQHWIGVVVVREGPETLAEISESVISDVTRVLADDIRSDVTTSAKR